LYSFWKKSQGYSGLFSSNAFTHSATSPPAQRALGEFEFKITTLLTVDFEYSTNLGNIKSIISVFNEFNLFNLFKVIILAKLLLLNNTTSSLCPILVDAILVDKTVRFAPRKLALAIIILLPATGGLSFLLYQVYEGMVIHGNEFCLWRKFSWPGKLSLLHRDNAAMSPTGITNCGLSTLQ
jgi:hypothetical protein